MKAVVLIIIIALLSFVGLTLFNRPKIPEMLVQTSIPTLQDHKVDIKASFTIVTGNIIRSFKAEKYHNKSSDVYIESSDPTIVHVTKSDVTWDDFFRTLPMTLTKDCLITGDGETLCNGKNGVLKFYLNDIQISDFLDRQIKDGDKTLIKFIF